MTTMNKAVFLLVLLRGPGLAFAICATKDGLMCLFPFKYGSTTFSKCAPSGARTWCATEVKEDGKYKSYGYCAENNCKHEEGDPVPSDVCPTEDGDQCVFPFKSGSTTYTECADYKGKKWCATSLTNTGQYAKYGYCNTAKCEGGTGIEEKIRKLEKQMEIMEFKNKKLEQMIEANQKDSTEIKTKLQKVPYMHTCGFASEAKQSGIVKYNNTQSENFNDFSALSTTNGIFTAHTKAFFTVSFSSTIVLVGSSTVTLELLKNGETLDGGKTVSKAQSNTRFRDVSRTLVVFMAENDKLSLHADLGSGGQLINISLCLSFSRPYKRPDFIPQTPQTQECMRAGAPLRGRCLNIEPGSSELETCKFYGYKASCTSLYHQGLCDGNGQGGPAGCVLYKYSCPQSKKCKDIGLKSAFMGRSADYSGPSGSFTYLPPRFEISTTNQNSSEPCTCVAFYGY